MKNFWISWYATPAHGAYTLNWPWWISGQVFSFDDDDGDAPPIRTIVAGVRAANEEAAKEIIYAAHDKRPEAIDFRFHGERPDDWSPYASDRFQRADWMPDWPPPDTSLARA